jgi:Domain of unknown function (DUF4032)
VTSREREHIKLAELNVPAVSVVGVVVDRGPDADAILVTRFLDYSTTYRAVFSSPRGGQPTDRLVEDLVELLVRELRGRLAPPEIFHEILEHRWYMSEAAGTDVGPPRPRDPTSRRCCPGCPNYSATTAPPNPARQTWWTDGCPGRPAAARAAAPRR